MTTYTPTLPARPKLKLPPAGLHLPAVDRLELHFPELPPSANHMFVNSPRGGRHKSKEYNAWLKATGLVMKSQFRGRVPGPAILDLTFCRMSVNADLDNRIKPTADFLVSHGLIDDDRHVMEIHARWGGLSGCKVIISARAA